MSLFVKNVKCFRFFNVKFGDLFSVFFVEGEWFCLVVCCKEWFIVVGLYDFSISFRVF